MVEQLNHWHDTVEQVDVDYDQQVERMKETLRSFSRFDHRAMTRRIKPSAMDMVAKKILETCTPDSSEEQIVEALGMFALSRLGQKAFFFTVREMETQLTQAWKDAAKKAASQ